MIKQNKLFILCGFVLLFCVLIAPDVYAGADSIFKNMAESIGSFATGFRKIAIVMGAFALVMFSFMAISGKINFKHLGYIALSLFFLGGVATFISSDALNGAELPSSFNTGNDTYQAAVGM